MKVNFISEKVFSSAKEAHDLFEQQRFGEKDGEKIIYSLSEAFYLFKEKKLEILDYRDKVLDEKELLRKFEKADKKFMTKFFVFRDLRRKGYVVKSAFKFGAEFRIYEKGEKVGENHSKWICFPVDEAKTMTWHEFSSKNRIAHSTKKNLLIAVVDEEGAVSYFEVQWKKI